MIRMTDVDVISSVCVYRFRHALTREFVGLLVFTFCFFLIAAASWGGERVVSYILIGDLVFA